MPLSRGSSSAMSWRKSVLTVLLALYGSSRSNRQDRQSQTQRESFGLREIRYSDKIQPSFKGPRMSRLVPCLPHGSSSYFRLLFQPLKRSEHRCRTRAISTTLAAAYLPGTSDLKRKLPWD
ncbi:hypothetical protein QBC37DRAFT_35766 [Rhypophila decipiens]|uniref:Secreted protein n=1 Tax=Rhypophila decipiens TaxID=261697 RepID=A0AAN6Y330_9PEZI|nr:hypothetical protein QBC37DRAFT_35766 [Rhypophila decipiens]